MTFYNEFDRNAAAWLRELAAQGHISEGVVDERSITEVGADELAGFRRVHLFAGIGGWDYALRLAGWPEDEPVWTGSCPCQPFSNAGRRRGTSDERHLWPHFARLVRECRPATIFGEQVASAAGRAWFAAVRADLEAMGYAVGGADLCAAGVGAPHIRQRIYFVAYLPGDGQPRGRRTRAGRAGLENGGALGVAEPGSAGARKQGGSVRGRPEDSIQHGFGFRDDAVAGRTALSVADAERRSAERHGLGVGAAARGPQGAAQERERFRADAGDGGDVGGAVRRSVGDADGSGSQGRIERRDGAGERTARTPGVGDFWSDCHWLPCRDGKARPVEPGTFPLANGVPPRVGRRFARERGLDVRAGNAIARRARSNRVIRLRGYGNAIVPEVAAQFIRAFIEAREGR